LHGVGTSTVYRPETDSSFDAFGAAGESQGLIAIFAARWEIADTRE
jgi:hypothetical protein